MPSLSQTIGWLLVYKYYILFPLAIFEGPIVTVIAGFFVATGFLNVFLIYIIVILADFLGDTLLYLLGRQGNSFIVKHGAKIGLTAQKLRQADDCYKNNSKKTVVMSKIFHGIGIIGLISAGILHINFKHYIRLCILVSFVQTAAFLIVGFLFGHAYLRIAEYLDYFAAFISALALLAIAFIIYYKSKKSS